MDVVKVKQKQIKAYLDQRRQPGYGPHATDSNLRIERRTFLKIIWNQGETFPAAVVFAHESKYEPMNQRVYDEPSILDCPLFSFSRRRAKFCLRRYLRIEPFYQTIAVQFL